MRFSALIPVLFCAASLVLTFLCLFAGHKKGWMEDYSVLTLNTSRIGENLLDVDTGDNDLANFIDNIANGIIDSTGVEQLVNSIAREIGIHDFYSAHIMSYCEGYYVPGPVPNATLSKSDIDKNVTDCLGRQGLYRLLRDPEQLLQNELDNAGITDINLAQSLNWPEDIDRGLRVLNDAAIAMFVLYCIACGLIGLALISALISFFLSGRLSAFLNIILDWLAFIVVGVASAIATAIAVKGSDVIRKYGEDIGITATQGNKFLALTWVATGLMLLASIVWCFECVMGRKRQGRSFYEERKDG